jgi:hypothetical protein
MSLQGTAIPALCFFAIAVGRRSPSRWIVGVLGRTAMVMHRIDRVVRRVDHRRHHAQLAGPLAGDPEAPAPWDKIAFFGPAVIVTAYFIYEMSQPREANR